MENKIKEMLSAGKVAYGGWEVLNSVPAADLLAQAGYDWVCADIEHTTYGIADVAAFASMVKARGAVPVARVFDCTPTSIRRVVDAGIQGIIVPHVSTREDAREAVHSVKLPPVGRRGIGAGAYASYGVHSASKVATINADTFIVANIETQEGVENIDEIVAIEGIDGVFIGPLDLSYSMGLGANTGDDRVRHAIDRVLAAAKQRKKFCGIHVMDMTGIRNALCAGYRFIALGFDASFIYEGAKNVLRQAAETALEVIG